MSTLILEVTHKDNLLQIAVTDDYETEYYTYGCKFKPTDKDIDTFIKMLYEIDLNTDDELIDQSPLPLSEWDEDWSKDKGVVELYRAVFG